MVFDPVVWMAEYMGSGSVHCVCIELYMPALDSSGCAYKYHNIVYTRDSIPLMDWNRDNTNPNTDSESITPHSTVSLQQTYCCCWLLGNGKQLLNITGSVHNTLK